MKTTTLLLVLFFSDLLSAQKIDNTASFRNIDSPSYFRFNYDNDYFAASDRNYTQGYSIELVTPWLKSNPDNYLFPKPKNAEFKYGLAVEHIGFTPYNYKSPEIQLGDRPFAAAIMLKSFAIATDTTSKARIVSSLSLGLIGPGAFGKEMQVAIHEATGNKIPMGWQHQIRNDIVINYELTGEAQLYSIQNIFALNGNATLRLGSLFTNASVGVSGVLGIINSPYSSPTKRFKLYLYSQPLLNAIAYDATLQGGLLNRTSRYTISDNNLERLTAQHNYGLILQTRTLYFEYSRTAITREFASGNSAKWGGVKVGFTF